VLDRRLHPRLIGRPNKVSLLRRLYPDGRIISVIRDPVSWFASAKRWSRRGEWDEPAKALAEWTRSANGMLSQDEQGATAVIAFDDLLTRTADTMELLAAYLGIEMHPSLLSPTINTVPVRANSSFDAGDTRVSQEPLGRERFLDGTEADEIRVRSWELYERVLAIALRPPSS
jgi:hypothetical protein